MENSNFSHGSLNNCKIENCDLTGLTIDGISVEEALEYYQNEREKRGIVRAVSKKHI